MKTFVTVAEALTGASEQLAAVQIETPRFEAQLLLAWTLKLRREDLARSPERVLTGREQLIFDKAVSLRVLRRPLPYITGEAWFYGRPFKINRAVLIPRPETEMLVSLALELCGGISEPQIADIGTGSGCLAVTLACERPEARVWATDLSGDALKLARKNVVRYGSENRVLLMQGDLLGPLPDGLRCDVVVSNPPYITEAEIPSLQPEVRDYEPVLALSGLGDASGTDGTALHRRLLAEAPPYLKPDGRLLLEVGLGQAQSVSEIARDLGYVDVTIKNDFSGIGRVVTACLPKDGCF
ncbi:MAG: peptide chain release factor N(5)-glutamine methyltransferase [Janthinobacterium lividum]